MSAGGEPQKRYERLRETVEQYPSEECPVAERWEEEKKCFGQRFERYGLLGLLDADPAGYGGERSFWREVPAVSGTWKWWL